MSRAQAARVRHIEKRALARIAKKPVLSHAGDENIGKAIVVVVADGDPHSVHFEIQPSGLGHVRECAVAIVLVEPQGRALALVPGPVHPVNQQDVLPAVGVIVEKRAAGAQCLRKQFAAVGTAVVLELNACAARDVRESKRRRRGISAQQPRKG